ncbi:MAG TPA: hypothetical protein DEV85_06990 [Vibrio sp.]|uniref:hypothetical protein n=1 Tax=Vibrio sp. TaxID=678 RepID=UPI000EEF797C|nr:hypothetical protein [Vibrio sp.]HCH01619.1 hypothetical protein [Vibrio sp.]
MAKFLSKSQQHELKSLGLSVLQVEECESLLKQVPAIPELKSIKTAIQLLGKVQSLLDDVQDKDPRSYFEIADLLNDSYPLGDKPIESIQKQLKAFIEHQKGVYVFDSNLHTGNQSLNVTTPESRNYYRYEVLTKLWKDWSKEIKLSRSSEFILFLTVCLEGSYSEKAANRVYTNYKRYYQGKSIAVEDVLDSNQPFNDLELKITYKSVNGEKPRVETRKTTFPNLEKSALNEQINKLKKQRN